MIPVRGFEGKRVAVFGLARSGMAAARAWLEARPEESIAVVSHWGDRGPRAVGSVCPHHMRRWALPPRVLVPGLGTLTFGGPHAHAPPARRAVLPDGWRGL